MNFSLSMVLNASHMFLYMSSFELCLSWNKHFWFLFLVFDSLNMLREFKFEFILIGTHWVTEVQPFALRKMFPRLLENFSLFPEFQKCSFWQIFASSLVALMEKGVAAISLICHFHRHHSLNSFLIIKIYIYIHIVNAADDYIIRLLLVRSHTVLETVFMTSWCLTHGNDITCVSNTIDVGTEVFGQNLWARNSILCPPDT